MVEEVRIREGKRLTTTRRSFFVEDEMWDELERLAKLFGTSRSQIIREAITDKMWDFRRRESEA